MPYVSEWDVKALFKKFYHLYSAPTPGRCLAVQAGLRTRHDCCYYELMQGRNPFGQPACPEILAKASVKPALQKFIKFIAFPSQIQKSLTKFNKSYCSIHILNSIIQFWILAQ